MRVSRIARKRAITGGLLLAAACAAAVPATAAHAGTHAAGHTARANAAYGCAAGDVCMYFGDPRSGAPVEHSWSAYRCYKLSGNMAWRWVFNNQVDGATATIYPRWGCGGTGSIIRPGQIRKGMNGGNYSLKLSPS